MKTARLIPILLTLLVSTACFQMEYAIVLEEDLSGTAGLDITVDLGQMAEAMATVQRSFSGEEGPPSEEDIAAAREELLSDMEEFQEEDIREEIAGDLPEGIELLDAQQTVDGLRTSIDVDLRFDHISNLNQLDVAPDESGPIDSQPFGDLEVVEEGNTIVLRHAPVNPVKEAEQGSAMLGDMGELIGSMFEHMRVAFTVEAPFEIEEHNATQRDGNRLSWVYDFEALSGGTPEGIYVRYRK
jgi:hypothetical protein